ncbi:MAG: TetR/AcrR family transcriptional regulator [Desulfobacterales bacterium]
MTQLTTDNTRERILDQAERLFAKKGFEAVSVREITGAAESNLAAINYHFGSKMNLYLQVFRERWLERTHRVRKNFFNQIAANPKPGIDEIVDALARAFLDGPLSDEERHQHVQLMQRELSHPSDALKMVVEEVMKPYQQQLSDLIRPNLPAEIDEERLRLSIVGIIGLTLYFTFARPAVSMIMGRDYNQKFNSILIEHIKNFSLNGLNSLMEEK